MTITAQEIIGELRRVTRQYEVFKEAEKVATFLSEKETYTKKLEQNIAALELQVKEMNDWLDRLEEEGKAKAAETEALVNKHKKEAESIRIQSEQTLIKAKEDHEAFKQVEAKKQAVVREELASLEREKADLQKKVADLHEQRLNIMKDLDDKHKQFLKVISNGNV